MLLGVGADAIEDDRVDRLFREMRLEAEIHQRFVGVIADISFHFLLQSDRAVQVIRIFHLVLIQRLKQLVQLPAQLLLLFEENSWNSSWASVPTYRP